METTEYEEFKNQLISLFKYNTDAILLLSKDGFILDVNQAFIEMGRYEKKEVLKRHFQEFVINEPGEEEPMLLALNEQFFVDRRFRLIAKDNTSIGCLMRVNPIKEQECLVGYFLIVKGMVQLDKIAERYLESELNYRMIAENIEDVLVLMDNNFNYLYVSPSSKEVFGFDYTKVLDREPFFNIHPDYIKELTHQFKVAVEKEESFEIKLKAFHAKHGFIWTEIKGKPIYDKSGHFLHMLLIARDISKEQKQEEQLKYFAYHDMLTGLPNRRLFSKQLDKAIFMLSEQHTPFALMLLDMDDFKQINDSYGHEIGDKVIIEFAARLQHSIEERGLVARLGGDEFVILLCERADEVYVKTIAQQIKNMLREPVIIQHTNLEITASIGIAFLEEPPLTAEQALRYADDALYKGKSLGKNTFEIYQTEE